MTATETTTMKTTKHDRGSYRVHVNGRIFSVESRSYRAWLAGDAFDGFESWVVCEMRDNEQDGYWNDFATKRDAIEAIREGIEAGD